MSANNFRSHFWPFQIDTQLFFKFLLTKWPPAAILDGTTMSFIELVRDIWMSNACVKFEEHSLKPSKVIALTMKLWRGGGPRPRRGGCVADENIIFLGNILHIDVNGSLMHILITYETKIIIISCVNHHILTSESSKHYICLMCINNKYTTHVVTLTQRSIDFVSRYRQLTLKRYCVDYRGTPGTSLLWHTIYY